MGIFDKLKQIVSNKSKEEVKDSEVESYSKGLEKTRNEFVSKLNVLGIKYTKIDDAYFEELEQILIMADIGVNTVMNFIDRLNIFGRKKSFEITQNILNNFGLNGKEKSCVEKISGGERQRVSLARAVVFPSGILLFC